MDKLQLEQSITMAKMGDVLAREELIIHYKPYIINVASHVTKKYITWSDEEASIALISFNRAIDTYESEEARTFQSYSYLLINRALIDYYRKEKKDNHIQLSINEEAATIDYEQDRALEIYHQSVQSLELVEEIVELDNKLAEYNITFEELEDYSPKHKDTKTTLVDLAFLFVKDIELVNSLLQTKKLPIAACSKKLNCKRKTLERHRKYLITLILVNLHPQWVNLSQYIQRPA